LINLVLIHQRTINIVSSNDYLVEVRIVFLTKLFLYFLSQLEILILDHCNVFYALARPSDAEQVELIVREKTRQEREQKNKCLLSAGAGHNRTPSGLSISSTHSR
jgi:hypothetical protein